MGAIDTAELRKRYARMETCIVSTDKQALTMLGDNGVVYRQRADHWWSGDDGDADGAILWHGSAFHDHGIHMRPFYVRVDGAWINVFTGKRRK